MTVTGIPEKVLSQVCVIVRDVDRSAQRHNEILGFDMSNRFQVTRLHDHTHATYYGQPTDSRARLTSIDIARLQFELLQPLDTPSAWMDYLQDHGEGIHHVAFFVPKTDVAAQSLVDHGYTMTQQGLFTGQTGMYSYFDTEKDLGIVVELLEHFGGSPQIDEPPLPRDRGIGTDVVCQVGIIVSDRDKTSRRWSEVFGVPEAFRVETPGFDKAKTIYRGQPSEATAKLAFFNFGQLQIELIQPDDKPSVWREFLEHRGEGAQHIAFRVDNTQRVTDYLAAFGIPVVQQGLYADGSGMYTYVGSEEALGVMVELLEDFPR